MAMNTLRSLSDSLTVGKEWQIHMCGLLSIGKLMLNKVPSAVSSSSYMLNNDEFAIIYFPYSKVVANKPKHILGLLRYPVELSNLFVWGSLNS